MAHRKTLDLGFLQKFDFVTLLSSVKSPPAEAFLHEEKHLAVPSVGAQRPAVRERYDRAFAPVLVIDLRPVSGRDGAHAYSHEVSRVKVASVCDRGT